MRSREEVLRAFDAPSSSLHTQSMADALVKQHTEIETLQQRIRELEAPPRDRKQNLRQAPRWEQGAYGPCPKCGAQGRLRERRPNGNDICENGHTYPSNAARIVSVEAPRGEAVAWAEVENAIEAFALQRHLLTASGVDRTSVVPLNDSREALIEAIKLYAAAPVAAVVSDEMAKAALHTWAVNVNHHNATAVEAMTRAIEAALTAARGGGVMRFRLPELSAPWYRWHRWFAWHPVTIGGEVVWLEYVERYIDGFCGIGHFYEYRFPHPHPGAAP